MEQKLINPSATSFTILSAGLVMLMTPGLALFYGGMVRKKNFLHTVMYVLLCMGLISVEWVLWGYSFAFSPGGKFIGGLKWFGLRGVSITPYPAYSEEIPHILFMAFQMMFAVITPALIVGAVVERMRFSSFLLFVLFWTTLVYNPVAHWVWGEGGWLRNMEVLDFAGGLVVHLTSGVSGLAAALLVGKRRGYGKATLIPQNLSVTVLGTALLWLGWFGFNAGSALTPGAISSLAFVNTHIAASVSSLSYILIEWLKRGKPTTLGFCTGAVAGLVAITPACGFVSPFASILTGAISGPLSYFAIAFKAKVGYDDSLDVFGVHGVNGAWGSLATGLFAMKKLNPIGVNGLLFGEPALLFHQFLAIGAVGAYSFILTFLILLLLSKLLPLRVSEREEEEGLDISILGEQIN